MESRGGHVWYGLTDDGKRELKINKKRARIWTGPICRTAQGIIYEKVGTLFLGVWCFRFCMFADRTSRGLATRNWGVFFLFFPFFSFCKAHVRITK